MDENPVKPATFTRHTTLHFVTSSQLAVCHREPCLRRGDFGSCGVFFIEGNMAKRTSSLVVQVTPEQKELIKAIAEKNGLTMSSWVLFQILNVLRDMGEGAKQEA